MDRDQCDAIFDRVLTAGDESEFCHYIAPLFDVYQILSVGLGRGNIMWRARLVEDQLWSNLCDLDYPPADKARVGRLNDTNSPCFYVAKDVETALLEIEAKEGQLVQVAGFRILKGEMLQLIVIGEYANVYKSGYVHLTGVDPDRTIHKLLNQDGPEVAQTVLYIDRFLASVLNDPHARENGYMFSRALGALLHSKIKSADGIAFPSVRDPGGFNYAVHPKPSDRVFQNVACLLVRVGKSRRFHFVDHDIISAAQRIDDDLNFIWSDQDSHKVGTMYLYGMTKEEYDLAMSEAGPETAIPKVLSMYSPRVRP